MSFKDRPTNTPQAPRRRVPTLHEIREVAQFKTFYLILVLGFTGIVLVFTDVLAFSPTEPSRWRGVLMSLGIALITSAIVSLLYEVWVKWDITEFVSDDVARTLSSSGYIGSTFTPELKWFKSSRTTIDFDDLCNSATKFLKIVGLSANDVLSPHTLHLISQKLEADPTFYVRFLLLNPWTVLAQRRALAAAYHSETEFFGKLLASLNQLRDVETRRRSVHSDQRFEVRVYNEIPSLSLILDEDDAIVTPIVVSRTGGASPVFCLHKTAERASAYDVYNEHFDSVWSKAMTTQDLDLADLYRQTRQAEAEMLRAVPNNLKNWWAKYVK